LPRKKGYLACPTQRRVNYILQDSSLQSASIVMHLQGKNSCKALRLPSEKNRQQQQLEAAKSPRALASSYMSPIAGARPKHQMSQLAQHVLEDNAHFERPLP